MCKYIGRMKNPSSPPAQFPLIEERVWYTRISHVCKWIYIYINIYRKSKWGKSVIHTSLFVILNFPSSIISIYNFLWIFFLSLLLLLFRIFFFHTSRHIYCITTAIGNIANILICIYILYRFEKLHSGSFFMSFFLCSFIMTLIFAIFVYSCVFFLCVLFLLLLFSYVVALLLYVVVLFTHSHQRQWWQQLRQWTNTSGIL